jgi:hypothetical protein
MSKFSFKKIVLDLQKAMVKHSPEILTGLGITGFFTATGLAIAATPKAMVLIDDKKKEENVESLPKKEVVKTCWKCYIPTAAMTVASTACLIGAHSVQAGRVAALTAAYKMSENAFAEYKENVIEAIGERKEREVRDKIAKKHIDNDPIGNHEVILTGKGDTMCYDTWSKRYFKSDLEKIRRAVNELNRQMINEMYVSLNDFYDEIGLSHSDLGYKMGWNLDKGFIDIHPSAQLDENDEPCIAIAFTVEPQYNFDRLM